jgi:hypothetical protein
MTIRTAHRPATDLELLLHKRPEHVHTREFPFGNATVSYPEATEDACTAAILFDVDPVGMVRGRAAKAAPRTNTSTIARTSHRLSVVLPLVQLRPGRNVLAQTGVGRGAVRPRRQPGGRP